MTIATTASIQSCLDRTAQGNGVRLQRSVRISSTVESRYVVPVISYAGQSKWIDTSVSSSASQIAINMLANLRA